MKQGKQSVTEYWNEFRLEVSEAELDESPGGALLLEVMNTELQKAWGASSKDYEDREVLAQWAVQKGNQASNGQAYPRIAINKEPTTRDHYTLKPRGDISTHK